nr:MAG TPA: hypothetical protein [Caudoviricetes sp.]
MIDEKKIEEAANKYASSSWIDDEYPGEIQEAFNEGINWFLGNLWHPASEVPKTFKRIIAKCHSDRVKYEDMMFIGTISWNEKVKNKGIICWLYINDLLEGGK